MADTPAPLHVPPGILQARYTAHARRGLPRRVLRLARRPSAAAAP